MGNVYLKVSVDDKTVVHVLQTQDDFSSVETHFFLAEHTVLRQVVVQIAPWTQTHTQKYTQKWSVSVRLINPEVLINIHQ